jgi:serine/threonine protein kinase
LAGYNRRLTLDAGARLGPYEITAPLGAGGMGQVYRAATLASGRDVASKSWHPDLVHDPLLLARFEQEAKAPPR